MRKERIESLTDLVFGLALSLTSIALILRAGETIEDVFYSLFWFTFNFLLLISMWFGYSRLLEHIDIESPAVLNLNVALLLLVSLEPYLFNLMVFGEAGDDMGVLLDVTSTLYALCLGGIWLVLGALHHQAAKGGEQESMLRMRNARLFDTAVFLLSAVPLSWEVDLLGIPIRFWMWFLSIPSGLILEAMSRIRR